jgi:hypothetical protein
LPAFPIVDANGEPPVVVNGCLINARGERLAAA